MSDYGMSVHVPLPYARAIEATTQALKREGFGVLTTIDVKATLKEKIGEDIGDYVILGACNPTLAHAGLKSDIDLGLLLPCNVTVRAANGDSIVSIIDPAVFARISDAEGLAEVADLAKAKLTRVLEELKGALP